MERESKILKAEEINLWDIDNLAFHIIEGDWFKVAGKLPHESVDFIVSSPPYNLDKNYSYINDHRPMEEYLNWHRRILTMCYMMLKPGGRLAWQVGSIVKPDGEYFPLHHWVSQVCREIGLIMRGEIVWNKNQIPKRTAWGSWKSASNNKLLPPFEYVEVFCKEHKKLQHKGEDSVSKENFTEWTNALWSIQPETKLSKEHPAPFPVELPRRLIEMNTYIGDVVLDPFVGLGSTCVAAKRLGRIPIGVEIDPIYADKAVKRMNSERYSDWIQGDEREI